MTFSRAGRLSRGRAQKKAQTTQTQTRGGPSIDDKFTWKTEESQSGREKLKEAIRQKPHYLFNWIDVDAGRENEWLTADVIVENHGVREDILLVYLVGEIRGEKNVLSLPWAILSVILYALMMIGHEGITMHQSLNHAIQYDIAENANFGFSAPGYMGHKNYQDVNCHADFWSWMSKGFMPLISPTRETTSEDSGLDLGLLTPLNRSRYLWHSAKVVPVKLAQERAIDIECINGDMQRRYDLQCTAPIELDLKLRPTQMLVAQSNFQEDVSKTVWLNGFEANTKQTLKDLEAALWLNTSTTRIQVSFLTYESDHDIVRRTDMNFLFSRSGHIWKQFTQRTIALRPYHAWAYIFDICFFLNVTTILGTELWELITHLRKRTGSLLRGLVEYMGIWNVVDWLFIITSYIVLALWFVRLDKLAIIERALLDIPPEASACSDDCSAYYNDVFDLIEDAGSFIRGSGIVPAFGPLVVMCRLFKAFSAQPRLAMVTETLRRASSNLAHYLIVFLSLFATYAVMGVAFFGRELPQYATLDRAFPSLFLAALGDFDFSESEKIGRGFAFIFYWAFMMVVVLVMLSMLIAIIMDVYMEVKAHALKTETLWAEMADIARRGWENFKKIRVSLGSIKKQLSPTSDNVVTIDSFMERVPGLPRWQAERLMVSAIREFAMENYQEPENLDVKNFTDDVIHMLTGAVGADAIHQNLKITCSVEAAPDNSRATAPAALHLLPTEELLRLAQLKLRSGCDVPEFEGSAELIKHSLETAQTICANVAHSITC